MPREILVDWNAEDGGGGLSVLYFDSAAGVPGQRQNLETFLDAIQLYLANTTSYVIRQEGRELNNATGQLTGVWSDPTARTGQGTGSSFSVSNSDQLLVRWSTNDIVNGRFVRGRTNIPGVDQQYIDGDWVSTLTGIVSTAANVFLASSAAFGIWHRPVNGAGGSFHLADNASVWSEAAVQRKRRS